MKLQRCLLYLPRRWEPNQQDERSGSMQFSGTLLAAEGVERLEGRSSAGPPGAPLQLHSERIVMVEWWGSIIIGGPLEC